MVGAEIPLWAGHTSSSSAMGGNNAVGGSGAALPTTAATTNSNNESHATPVDSKNMSLLSSLLRGGTASRSPVYSVDIHPDGTRFATAGGDGTVRIWNAFQLFLPTAQDEGKNGRFLRGPRGYESGGGTSAEAECSTDGDHDIDANAAAQDSHANSFATNQAPENDEHDNTLANPSSWGAANDDINQAEKARNDCDNSEPNRQSNYTSMKMTTVIMPNGKKRKRATLTTLPLHSSSAPESNHNNNNSNAAIASNDPNDGNHRDNGDQQASISQPRRKNSYGRHRLLCTLSSHTGSVLTVRWSPSGTFLASGGDDATVLIYSRSTSSTTFVSSSSSFGSNDDVESWTRTRLCRGHALDVVGLAWSPDNAYLVSCSLDSSCPVAVWKIDPVNNNSDNSYPNDDDDEFHGRIRRRGPDGPFSGSSLTQNPIAILGRSEHASTVKGVAFDPAGRYLATSADDATLCIWRAGGDWALEKRIDTPSATANTSTSKKRRNSNNNNAPALSSSATSATNPTMNTATTGDEDALELSSLSLFRRISFAPDGSHVCSTNAILRGKNVASMIAREGWSVDGGETIADHDKRGNNSKNKNGDPGANLVGHKQPVVASRYCPYFLDKSARNRKSPNKDSSNIEEDPNAMPSYGTLLALGDKGGFVTVWSTRRTRPIFKLQCGENRCTVTDLSWGLFPGDDNDDGRYNRKTGKCRPHHLTLLVSLLDGHITALRFAVPKEVGPFFLDDRRGRLKIFRLRYGIQLDTGDARRHRQKLVDDGTGPKLIENALQYTMEQHQHQEKRHMKASSQKGKNTDDDISRERNSDDAQTMSITSSGKKRIRPMLVDGSVLIGHEANQSASANGQGEVEADNELGEGEQGKSTTGRVNDAVMAASKAVSETENMIVSRLKNNNKANTHQQQSPDKAGRRHSSNISSTMDGILFPHAEVGVTATSSVGVRSDRMADRIHSVELPSRQQQSPERASDGLFLGEDTSPQTLMAACTNENRPISSAPCITLTISRAGEVSWKDQLVGATCTSIASCRSLLAIGTSDGTVHLYGTSPTNGWACGAAFRSHPPLVYGAGIVFLQLIEGTKPAKNSVDADSGKQDDNSKIGTSSAGAKRRRLFDSTTSDAETVDMVILTSDGTFGVYTLSSSSSLRLRFGGTIMPAMNHLRLASRRLTQQSNSASAPLQPSFSRLQLTDSDRLILILALRGQDSAPDGHAAVGSDGSPRRGMGRGNNDGSNHSHYRGPATFVASAASSIGLLQAFVYDRPSKLWMRLSDGRFSLSDFYATMPSTSQSPNLTTTGPLSRIDNAIRSGTAAAAALISSSSGHGAINNPTQHFQHQRRGLEDEFGVEDIVTRSHCEDRMACALALGSSDEFRLWLGRYSKALALQGDKVHLRLLVDLLVGSTSSHDEHEEPIHQGRQDGTSVQVSDQGSPPSVSSSPLQCWWLSSATMVLGLNRKQIIRDVVLPAMIKNRSLQRLTNELSMELDAMDD